MTICRKSLLKDMKGISSAAIAALFSIVIMLAYLWFMGKPGGTETLFVTIYEFFKAVGVLDKNFDPREILNSPVGGLVAYIGSFVGMVLLVAMAFAGTKYSLEIVSSVSTWRKKRNEMQQRAVGQYDRERDFEEFD